MARILVAVMYGQDRLSHALSQHELIQAHTLRSALEKSRASSFDAIMCGIAFDESRMFDFLRATATDARLSYIPFICCRTHDSEIIDSISDHLEFACRVLGARFVDFNAMEKEGREVEFVEFIENLIAVKGSGAR